MEKPALYIVDVFAEQRYQGNQLAVIRHAAGLSDGEMQQLTKEMNYSETTFILADEAGEAGYPVRIFTPAEEVPFAGHPTLGTAFIIQQEIINRQVEQVMLDLKIGQIPVTLNYSDGMPDILWMRQNSPSFGATVEASTMASILGLEAKDLDDRFPIQEVSTGLPFLIIPLRSLQAVKRCVVEKSKYFDLVKRIEAKALLVFCPETYRPDNNLNVRVFVDYFGIPEDPATGSGNGCLAGYLVKHRYLGQDQIDVKVEQGYEIGRPSLLFLKAGFNGNPIEVQVGGRVIMVAKGELTL